jgi:hypothetical protein
MQSSTILARFFSVITISFFIGLNPSPVKASLDTDALNLLKSDPSFSYRSKVFVQAVVFSLLQPQNKAKVTAGPWRFYLETGYHMYAVKDATLALLTSSGHSPASFQATFLKGGMGLPFGLNVETGVTQVVSEHQLTGTYLSISGQILDFATIVYTDMIPCMAASVTGMQVLSGPEVRSVSGSISIGAYHRQSLAQFAGIFQMHFADLDYPSVTHTMYRYGAVSSLPVTSDFYLKTDVLFPDLAATLSVGYRF